MPPGFFQALMVRLRMNPSQGGDMPEHLLDYLDKRPDLRTKIPLQDLAELRMIAGNNAGQASGFYRMMERMRG